MRQCLKHCVTKYYVLEIAPQTKGQLALAAAFVNLRYLFIAAGHRMRNTVHTNVDWSSLSPKLIHLALVGDIFTTETSYVPDFGQTFPQLSSLYLDDRPHPWHRNHPLVFPSTLTELVLGDNWYFSDVCPGSLTVTSLPRSLTSFTLFPSTELPGHYAFSNDWPESLTHLSLAVSPDDVGRCAEFLASLPRSLQHLSLPFSGRKFKNTPLKHLALANIPPQLKSLDLNWEMDSVHIPGIFASLPRTLTHLCVPLTPYSNPERNEVDFYHAVCSLSTLPPSLTSLGFSCRINLHLVAMASSLPRGLKTFGEFPRPQLLSELLPHLPERLTSLSIDDCASKIQHFSGSWCANNFMRYFDRFHHLTTLRVIVDDIQNSHLWRHLPPQLTALHVCQLQISGASEWVTPKILLNLPPKLTELSIRPGIIDMPSFLAYDQQLSHPDGQPSSPEIQPQHTGSWWSALPFALTYLDICVYKFSTQNMASLAQACPRLSTIDIVVLLDLDYAPFEDLIRALPASCKVFHLDVVDSAAEKCISRGPFFFSIEATTHLPHLESIRVTCDTFTHVISARTPKWRALIPALKGTSWLGLLAARCNDWVDSSEAEEED